MFGIITQKRCPKCGVIKPIQEFSKSKSRKSGFECYCKACNRANVYEWKKKDPERARQIAKNWRKANLEKSRGYVTEYQKRQKEKRGQEKLKNILSEGIKQPKQRDREKARAASRKHYYAHLDERREKYRKWKKNNPEKVLARKRNRRALLRGNGGKITDLEWKELLDKYGNKCLRCGKTNIKLTLDHVIPLDLGGPNLISNAQPLCHSCNAWKKNRHIDFRV